MKEDKLSKQDLLGKISEFNGLAERGGCTSRLHWDTYITNGKTVYRVILGSQEQLTYGACQCVCCEGTLRECFLAVHALVQVTAFECKLF